MLTHNDAGESDKDQDEEHVRLRLRSTGIRERSRYFPPAHH